MPRIVDTFGLRDIGNREIGVEVEVEGNKINHNIEKYWAVKPDGSLRGPSAEFVLKTPSPRNTVDNKINYLYSFFDKHCELNISDNCGVHIHVNCQHLTFKETFNFIVLYLIFEDLLVKWCGEDREGNLFCLRASDAEGLILALINAKQRQNFNNMLHNNYRYASINVTSLRRFGSLEFRALRTPDKAKPILDWIKILLRIKDFAVNTNDEKEFVIGCSAEGERAFTKKVFGPLTKHLDCPNLEELVINGIRRVQFLAFQEPQVKHVEEPEFNDELFNEEPQPEQPGIERWRLRHGMAPRLEMVEVRRMIIVDGNLVPVDEVDAEA